MENTLPNEIMRKAVKGISYISHPLRLRILEYLDVYGSSSVGSITEFIGENQITISQNLKKLRDADLVKTNKKGVFVFYDIYKEYPTSIFVCIRKLFASITNQEKFLDDDYKEILPVDFTTMVAGRIKLFANYDKMRILDYLLMNGKTNVSKIIQATNIKQAKVSLYLKRLYDDEFVKFHKEGRFIYYEITKGVHKTALQCIHKRYDNLKNRL